MFSFINCTVWLEIQMDLKRWHVTWELNVTKVLVNFSSASYFIIQPKWKKKHWSSFWNEVDTQVFYIQWLRHHSFHSNYVYTFRNASHYSSTSWFRLSQTGKREPTQKKGAPTYYFGIFSKKKEEIENNGSKEGEWMSSVLAH